MVLIVLVFLELLLCSLKKDAIPLQIRRKYLPVFAYKQLYCKKVSRRILTMKKLMKQVVDVVYIDDHRDALIF